MSETPPGGTGAPELGPAAEHTRPHRRRWLKILVLTLVGVLAVTGGAAAWFGWRLSNNLERIPDPFESLTDRPTLPSPTATAAPEPDATAEPEPVHEAMNILVLGSDSRISAGDPASWAEGAQRTDTIMLVHLAADGQSAAVMSIPRDSWVTVPGHGEAKINAAYSWGGPALLIETVEALTGVRIDHFAVTDFEAFAAMTDALGGVELTLSEDLYGRGDRGSAGQLLVTAGTHVLTGEQALIYVRERYTLPRGDFDRVQRQQAWLRAIMTAVSDQAILQDPARTLRFLDTVSRSVAVDEGLTIGVMRDLALRFGGLRRGDVEFFTVPVSGTGWSPDGKQSIVVLRQPELGELMAAVAADQVGAYLAANPDAVDRLGAAAP